MSGVVEWINKKKDFIYEELDTRLFENEDMVGKIEQRFVYPIICHIFTKGNDLTKMKERKFDDEMEVMHCLNVYQEVIAEVNMHVPFVPSIENFCMFMGWTANVYKRFMESNDTNIQAVMYMVDDYILESQLSAGQSGFSKANLTKFRSQLAGVHGQGLVTQKEENDNKTKAKQLESKEELQKKLKNLMGNSSNMIDINNV